MIKDQKNAGKGMTPKKDYNYKNWDENFDLILWDKNKKKDKTNEQRINERTETVSGSNDPRHCNRSGE
jgi:hypothetical protein